MIGMSKGNGHPFSFSAIINGYSDLGLAQSGWDGIYNYVKVRDRSEFGIQNLKVTHAWTQDDQVTGKLCEATLIENSVSHYKDMLGQVDAVIIARDDYEKHKEIAQPFLEDGLPVFIDKPLSLNIDDLRYFKPYMEKGQLMSCSGLRYAKELDTVRGNLSEYGSMKLIRGTVLFSWEKYGIHMLEAILSLTKANPVTVYSLKSNCRSVVTYMSDGSIVQIDALGNVPKIFKIEVIGDKCISSHEITDNFSMFRRTLWHFAKMINTNIPVVPVQHTLDTMRILIAGNISQIKNKVVELNSIEL